MIKLKNILNEAKFYVTYNKGRGQGKGLMGDDNPKVFNNYRSAAKYAKSAGSNSMTAYWVSDIDMDYVDNNGRKDKGQYSIKMGEGKVNETHLKKGQKVKYLGYPAVVTNVLDYNGKTYYSVSYDKGHGKTKAKNILGTSGAITEYGGAEFSKITSLQNYLTIDLDKFEKGLKDSKHKATYKKARKQFMRTVSAVAFEHSKLHEGK